jgi:hypothetical protein
MHTRLRLRTITEYAESARVAVLGGDRPVVGAVIGLVWGLPRGRPEVIHNWGERGASRRGGVLEGGGARRPSFGVGCPVGERRGAAQGAKRRLPPYSNGRACSREAKGEGRGRWRSSPGVGCCPLLDYRSVRRSVNLSHGGCGPCVAAGRGRASRTYSRIGKHTRAREKKRGAGALRRALSISFCRARGDGKPIARIVREYRLLLQDSGAGSNTVSTSECRTPVRAEQHLPRENNCPHNRLTFNVLTSNVFGATDRFGMPTRSRMPTS